MSNININKIKRQVLGHVKIVRALILGLVLALVLIFGIFAYKALAKSFVGVALGLGRDFVFPSSDRVKVSDGRINILLMGIGGAGHDGPNLTDTMILVTVNTQSKKMALISIPRDIWINDLKDKVNSAYMYGGIPLAKSTAEEILGVPINYGVVIDFSSFKDVIDAIGGVQVDVKNGFTDSQYPVAGHESDPCLACRYETVTFNPGLTNMDGATALIYVRSRHASGIEGSDIAREARQQLVLNAIIKKSLTPKVFANLATDQKLLNIIENNVITDMKPNEIATAARYTIEAKSNMKSYTILDNLLYNPANEYLFHNSIFTHAFVFVPNNKQSYNGVNEDFRDIHKWVQTVLP